MKENAAACFDSHFEIEAARRSLYAALESLVRKASPVHA
jgi:hypothetical protein